MKQLITMLFVLLFAGTALSQNDKMQTLTVQSSIQCEMCVNNLNKMFAEFTPVKDVEYDVPAKTITVKYNSKQTTPEELKAKINGVGYDADETMADIGAYLELDACCQKNATCAEGEKPDEH